ncbi:phage tail protein [Proteus mirabilis]|uniref:phage tail-collar fiber domain-containing protein n=1 Tax=Proteus mirabilis TaxID=584 RepID=UPI0025763605|nr:phage tail protein [Proteus mirabilis]MDM3716811.1 phage tail protein [Proteus mirabilis]
MSAKFFALLTVIGANKLAKATALGTTLKITQMAVGDGGGTLPTPDTQQTKLVGEKRRAGLNTLFVDPKNDSQIIAEQVIPENEGGYWIREIGLFDDEGSLIAVGNCPETYKPQLQEGSGRTQTIRMILTVSHTESVELKVDPSVILATRGFVNDAIESASKEALKEVEKNYATKEDVKKKFNIDNVVHEKGASKEKVISQKGVTELFQPKGNYQPAGNYVTTETFNLEINKKIDKSNISQQLANDVNKVPSLDLVAKELGNKQPKGNYQPAGDYAATKDLEKKFDKTGGHITGDVRITDGKSLRVNAPNNNGDTFIITREDGTSWIGNSYTSISINKDGLCFGNNPVVTTDRLRNGAYRSISGDAVFSGQNASAPLSMQTYADFRKVISYDVAESYPEGVSGGIATGKQIHKPELDMVCLLNIRGWYDKSGAPACGQIYITSTGNIGFRYNQYNAKDNAHYLMPVDIYCTNNTTVDNDGFIRKLGYTDNSIVFPIPWSQPTPPPGYLVCNGQWFNTSTYPKLAIAYPSGKLPDLRGEFIRGLDSGRGIDAGRSVLSAQKGNSLLSSNIFGGLSSSESNKWHKAINYIGITGTNNDGGYGVYQQIEGANGNETRPRNIAFLYIVRAA